MPSDPQDKSGAETPSTNSATTSTVAESGVPPNLVYAGIAVGLSLILIGIILLAVGKTSLLSSLMTCVGFGIVLASFGSKAGGTWAGWTSTGAGAMAILLFFILQYYTPSSSLVPAKRGQIRGDLSKIADIRIIDETPLYQFRDLTTSSVRFIILDRSLRSQRMSVQVDTTEDGPGREFFELIGDSREISKRYLSESTDTNQVVQWDFDYKRRIIKDGGDIIFAEPDQLDDNMLPRQQTSHTELFQWPTLVHVALAQTALPPAQPAQSNTEDRKATTSFAGLIADLRSDDTATRRNAREALVAIGVPAIAPMMAELRTNASEYRLKLGVVYALSAILKRNFSEKTAISFELKEEDFPILVSAASDNDKTIRHNAAEFLYLLEDPRAIPYSVEAARETNDSSKAANQVSILGKSSQDLPVDEREKILRDLRSGPGLNNDLLGNSGLVRERLGLEF